MEERWDTPVVPPTAPAGIRLVPPSPPPAPPGTGNPPPPSPPPPPWEPDPGGTAGFFYDFEDALNDFAVIRTTRETLTVFPDNADLAREMAQIVRDAAANLRRRFETTSLKLLNDVADYLSFRETMEQLAAEGVLCRQIDSMLKVDVFSRYGNRYWYLRGNYLPELRAPLSTPLYCSELMKDLLVGVEQMGDLAERVDDVFRDYLVIAFAAFASIDPVFYQQRED